MLMRIVPPHNANATLRLWLRTFTCSSGGASRPNHFPPPASVSFKLAGPPMPTAQSRHLPSPPPTHPLLLCTTVCKKNSAQSAPPPAACTPPMSDLKFSEKCDVYSYGMTCYELVTGRIPFEDYETRPREGRELVLKGDRPELPPDLDPFVEGLITSCWHPKPSKRPSFKDIIETLENGKTASFYIRGLWKRMFSWFLTIFIKHTTAW